jgi:hypothetical protein
MEEHLMDGPKYTLGKWVGGLAEWVEGQTAFLSVAFTWRLDEAYSRASWYRAAGYRVIAGGPAFFTRPSYLDAVAEVPRSVELIDGKPRLVLGKLPGAQARHNPMATKASDGCPVGCFFCSVTPMDGRDFTFYPDFTPRPVLTDNNLSALPAEYQQHIVDRYQAAGVPLLDANSGFEPKTFDEDVFRRWAPINRGPWRFGSDETMERNDVERVMRMLRRHGVSPRRIQVYTMIGHEPFAACMDRIQHVIAQGGEPYVQPIMKLNALRKELWVRFDWTRRLLGQVQRWANRRLWKTVPFAEYDASAKSAERHERQPDRLLV